MYFVKQASPKALPLFKGTFQQVVKWCLKAQKTGLLQHDQYEIRGGDLKGDPPPIWSRCLRLNGNFKPWTSCCNRAVSECEEGLGNLA